MTPEECKARIAQLAADVEESARRAQSAERVLGDIRAAIPPQMRTGDAAADVQRLAAGVSRLGEGVAREVARGSRAERERDEAVARAENAERMLDAATALCERADVEVAALRTSAGEASPDEPQIFATATRARSMRERAEAAERESARLRDALAVEQRKHDRARMERDDALAMSRGDADVCLGLRHALAAAERERDAHYSRNRAACRILVEQLGSVGPESVEDAAHRAVAALAAETERADTGHRGIAARAEESRALAERYLRERDEARAAVRDLLASVYLPGVAAVLDKTRELVATWDGAAKPSPSAADPLATIGGGGPWRAPAAIKSAAPDSTLIAAPSPAVRAYAADDLLAEIDALRAERDTAIVVSGGTVGALRRLLEETAWYERGAVYMREACAARLDARAESDRAEARGCTFANAMPYHLGAADALDEMAAALRAMPLRGTR